MTGLSKAFFKGFVWLYSILINIYFLLLKDVDDSYHTFHDACENVPLYDGLPFCLWHRVYESDIEDRILMEVGSRVEWCHIDALDRMHRKVLYLSLAHKKPHLLHSLYTICRICARLTSAETKPFPTRSNHQDTFQVLLIVPTHT